MFNFLFSFSIKQNKYLSVCPACFPQLPSLVCLHMYTLPFQFAKQVLKRLQIISEERLWNTMYHGGYSVPALMHGKWE